MSKTEAFLKQINDCFICVGDYITPCIAIPYVEAISDAQIKVPLRSLKMQGLIARANGIGKTKTLQMIFVLATLIFMISPEIYSQMGKVPPFQIIQSNRKVFKAENLPIDKPIIIVYFSPDCEECQKFTEELLKRMDDFKKASIAMITYLPVETVTQFIAKYNLNIYPNIFVGTEGTSFFLRGYYKIVRFPFIALYNKNGDLIKIYVKEENLDDLSDRLRDL